MSIRNVRIDFDEQGNATLEVNGQRIPCSEFNIDWHAGAKPCVSLSLTGEPVEAATCLPLIKMIEVGPEVMEKALADWKGQQRIGPAARPVCELYEVKVTGDRGQRHAADPHPECPVAEPLTPVSESCCADPADAPPADPPAPKRGREFL